MTEASGRLPSVRSSAKFALDVMSGALGMLSYIILFALAGITLIVGVGFAYETPNTSTGLLIASILTSLLFFLAGWALRYIAVTSGSFKSKLNTIKWTFMRWGGMLFRTVFISSIGFAGFIFSKPIGDIPFSQLTLNQVFGNLFAAIIMLGSIFWFFNFPKLKKNPESPDDNPYVIWGLFGILFAFLAGLISSLMAFVYAVWLI